MERMSPLRGPWRQGAAATYSHQQPCPGETVSAGIYGNRLKAHGPQRSQSDPWWTESQPADQGQHHQ